MKTGLKPVWAGRNMRLDPFRLPQVVSYATRDEQGDVTFMIDQRGAVIRRDARNERPAGDHRAAGARLPRRRRARHGRPRRQRHRDARASAQRSAALGAAAGRRRSRRRRRRLARLGRGIPAADAADRGRRHCPHARGIARRGEGRAGEGAPQAPRHRSRAGRASWRAARPAISACAWSSAATRSSRGSDRAGE